MMDKSRKGLVQKRYLQISDLDLLRYQEPRINVKRENFPTSINLPTSNISEARASGSITHTNVFLIYMASCISNFLSGVIFCVSSKLINIQYRLDVVQH